MTDNEALIAEARRWPLGVPPAPSAAPGNLIGRLADALEAASVERAVVEAQALEQAAEAYRQPVMKVGTAPDMVRDWLRARAVEIRGGGSA